ncbi:MAG: hypothetical protein Kow0069_12530 [Promethearchaeota archaeon]
MNARSPRLLAAWGPSNSGKTTALLALLRELKRRGARVLVAKGIHREGVAFDVVGKDTWKYRRGGADCVLANAGDEVVAFLPPRTGTLSSVEDLARRLEVDYLLVEGFKVGVASREPPVPTVACARRVEDLGGGRWPPVPWTLCVTGPVVDQLGAVGSYRGVPALDALGDPEAFARRVLALVEAGEEASRAAHPRANAGTGEDET